jgi:ubiquinone/menaquinone biosynthesis C-methylase UbiE
VYSNAVLDHLRDPLAALREMYRVLKAGGIAGIRTSDRNGYLMYPRDPVLDKAWQQSEANKAAQGVSVRIGTHLRKFLREVGFVRTEASASYDNYGTTESVQRLSNTMANNGGSTEVAAAWRRWGESPDAFFGHCLCEVVGWKE